MPVTIQSGKVQSSNKPSVPAPKPKPSFELFPTKLTMKDGRGIWISVPLPDRLSLVITIAPDIYGKKAPDNLSVAEWVKATGHYLQAEPFNTQCTGTQYFATKQWFRHVTLAMGKRGSTVRFQFEEKTAKVPALFRLDFNPRKLGRKGFATLVGILNDPNGPFRLEPIIEHARVTRIDIAIDLVGVQVDELLIRHKKQGIRSLYVGQDGVLETVYIHRGKTKAKPSGNVVLTAYDRRRERLKRGKAAPYGNADVTRIEITKLPKKPYNSFKKLADLADPYGDVMVGYAAEQISSTSHIWWQYVGLRRSKPHEQVIELLSLAPDTAKFFAKSYDVPDPNLVSGKASWDGWKQGLDKTGLSLLLPTSK